MPRATRPRATPRGESAAKRADVGRAASTLGPSRRADLWAGSLATVLGAVFGLHRIVDPDTFLQVVVGRAILNDPTSIGVSTFITGYPKYPYVEDKWLASVVVAVADALGGEHGLMAYQILLCALVAASWYWMQRVWRASPTLALVGVALALLACSFRLEPRPDTISHALLALMLGLAVCGLRFRTLVWVVPLVMVLWVNLHGYFVNGLLVLAAAAGCAALGDRTRSTSRPVAGELTARQRLVLLGLGLAACLVHPQGWRALANPVDQLVALHGNATFRGAAEEFASSSSLLRDLGVTRVALLAVTAVAALGLELHGLARGAAARQFVALGAALPWLVLPPPGMEAVPYRVTVVLFLMALFELPGCVRRRSLLGPALLLGFGILAIPLIRNLALVPAAALILLAPAWTSATGEPPRVVPARARAVVSALGVVAIVGAIAWLRLSDRLSTDVSAPARTGWGIDRDRFPADAVDFLERERLPGPLLNNFDIGGYLLYRLYPRRQVFIAGNTSMYPMAFLDDYRNAVMADESLADIHATYGTETVMLDLASPATRALTAKLATSPEWSLVFLGRGGALYLHATESTRAFAERHRVDLEARVPELASMERSAPAVPEWLGGKGLVFPGFNVGMFLFWSGRADLALEEARRLWRSAPSENLAVIEGEAARLSQHLVDDLPRLEDALRTYPTCKELQIYVTLGLASRADERLQHGALDDAERDLRAMIVLAPDACGPFSALAKAAVLRGDAQRARALVAESVRRDANGACRQRMLLDPQLAALL